MGVVIFSVSISHESYQLLSANLSWELRVPILRRNTAGDKREQILNKAELCWRSLGSFLWTYDSEGSSSPNQTDTVIKSGKNTE